MSHIKNKKYRLRNIIIFGVAIFFVGQLIMPVALVTTKTANAQWAVFETGSVSEITSQIWRQVKAAIKTAADVTYKNVLKTYVNDLAYRSAVGIATGDWGQKPTFITYPGRFLRETADIAAGDFLDEVANNWQGVDSKCYGYTELSCSRDQQCPPPILDCSTANMTVGTKSACNDSKPAMQQCIALGCRLIPAPSEATYDILKGIGVFEDDSLNYVEGAPDCANRFSLCDQPTTLKLNLNILARQDLESGGSGDTFGALEQGRCPVTSIMDNFEKQTRDLTANNGADFLKNLTSKQSTRIYLTEIQKTFTPEASEVGGFFSLTFQAKEEAAEAKEGEGFAQQLAGGIGNITSGITGAVETPGPLLEGAINNVFGTSLDVQSTYTGSLIADAIGTFTSTLSNKLMTKYFEGLVAEEVSSGGTTKSGGLFSRLLGGVRSGVTAAKLLFSDLQLVDYSVGGSIDIVTNLSSCPNPDNPTVDTCVIDSRFATAIQQEMTVQEAIDGGLLDGARTFGFEADGREPEYYNGYPYRSLVILRKYRIIPVGWELAAKYMQNYAPGRYSLSTLIAEYDNEESPFYRLINPNWVLKAPELYCAKEGAGPTIEFEQEVRDQDTNKDNEYNTLDAATNVVQRNSTYCADERTCLAENDDGSCKKFGYCVEEEPVWRFDGQSCEEQNNSCVAFDNGNAYLTNTVEYNGCNAENAGCQWYCQDYDTAAGWQCSNVTPPAGGSKISFNDKVNACSAAEEGCTELVEIGGAQGVNLVKNSGFEEYNQFAEPQFATDGRRDSGEPGDASIFTGDSLPDRFDYWSHTKVATNPSPLPPQYIPALQRSYASNDALGGNTSARLHWHSDGVLKCVAGTNEGVACTTSADCPNPGNPNAACSRVQLADSPNRADGSYTTQRIYTGKLTDGKTYTVSFYAKRADGGNCTINSDEIDINFTRDFGPGDTQYYGERFDVSTEEWTRYATSISFENASARWAWPSQEDLDLRQQSFILFIRHTHNDPFDCDILIDNVQVEEGGLTEYKEYGAGNTSYLTVAPDYLNCTGNPALDDEACENFAPVCSFSDVGCNQYSSINTGAVVNGTISNASACIPGDPYSCDQCPAEFVGCQAFRELATERVPYRPVVDPISFAPDSGLACSAADVGCEEYTNLEEVAQGGEGREYYSEIRQCVPANDGDVATFYTWEGSEEFGYQLKDYRLKLSNLAGNAPCTNMTSEDPFLPAAQSWPNCIDGANIDRDGDGTTDESYPAATCPDTEVGINPDCTEFFDTDGNSYYYLRSRVIYASDDCQSYRNSYDSAGVCDASTFICSNNGSYCENAGNPDNTICNDLLYHLIPGQGKECNGEYAGCRAYKGNAGYNTRTIFSEDFEDGKPAYLDTGILSSESVTVGGNSMLYQQGSRIITLSISGPENFPIPFESNKSYQMSFWAKGGTADVSFILQLQTMVNGTLVTYDFPGTVVARAGDWQQFTIGPITLDRGYATLATDWILLQSIGNLSGVVYLDNITVSEITDNIYMVKDSYDRCDGYENCQLYSDIQGVQHYLKSFTSLCDENRVGCQAFVDTKNTDSANAVEYPVSREQYIRGDLNNVDGINVADTQAFEEWINDGNPSLAPVVYETADVNGDGFVNTNIIQELIPPASVCAGDTTGNDDWDYLFSYLFCGGPAPSPTYVTASINQTIPADEMIYLVNNGQYNCSESVKGCQRLGRPTINNEEIVESYEDVYLVNNPDDYSEILCMFEENGCRAYNALSGSSYYFKDPGQKTCEYKRVSGENTSGWYKVGTNSGPPDCPVTDGMCYIDVGQNTLLNGVPCSTYDGNGDGNPDNIDICIINDADPAECVLNNKIVRQPFFDWTGQCPAEESGCIEFRDPETQIEGTADRCDVRLADGTNYGEELIECDSYYYIANEVDVSSCNGLVDREEGCRLFYDTTDPNLIYYSDLTQDGQAPATTCDPAVTTCVRDSNTIIKVRQDRTCSKWLECSSSIIKINDEGQTEVQCQEVALCDKMDSNTSHCVSWAEFTNANQTFSSPAFADLIKNYSGMVLAGLDWGRRCQDDPNKECEADADCDDGDPATPDVCGEPQIIEGQLPIAAMQEVGSTGITGNIIPMGDFGDSIDNINSILSYWLTGGGGDDPATPTVVELVENPLPYLETSYFDENWQDRDWGAGNADVWWTEEDEDGFIPSANANIDENNVLMVKTNTGGTDAQFNGATYNLGGNVVKEQEYVVSFKLKWNTEPTDFDRIRVQFGYEADDGVEFAYQSFGADVTPSSKWQEFILGPITAGYDDGGNELLYYSTNLNIIHFDVQGVSIEPVEYYLDDVSLKPVLQTQEEGGLVTRECRLYPRDDSLYCTYTDENNTTYQGWYGYCLEHDPNNINYCINWWPVDLLAGESNQIDTLPRINSSVRSPMYMCLQSEGNYSTEGIPSCYSDFNNNIGYCDGNNSFSCYNDSDCIFGPIDLSPCIAGGSGTEITQKYGRGAILGNRRVMRTHAWYDTDPGEECNNIENAGCRNTIWCSSHGGDRALPGLCGCAENDSLNGTFTLHPDDQYYEYQVEALEFVIVRGSHSDWPRGAKFVLNRDNDWDSCWSSNNNSICARINFDGDRRMTSIWARIRDWSSDRGGAWAMGLFHLRDWCTELVQVSTSSENSAWYNRTNANSSYRVADVDYGYAQHYTPFGAVIQPANGDGPEDWSIYAYNSVNNESVGPLQVKESSASPTAYAHSGSPLSFSADPDRPTTTTDGNPNVGGSSQRWCSTLIYQLIDTSWVTMSGADTTDTFYNMCRTQADIEKCYDPDDDEFTENDGYCIGVGQGFCQNDPSLRCTVASQATDCIGEDLEDYGPCVEGTGGAVSAEIGYNAAIDRLQGLFVNTYGAWTWDGTNYVPDGVTQNAIRDEYVAMPVCSHNAGIQKVVRDDPPNDFCGVPPTLSVTASNAGEASAQFINLGEEGGRVQFRLDIKANDEQLPVRMIEVDWNYLDGYNADNVITGTYGNGILIIDHVYQAPLSGGQVFRPVFRVVDSWGWCSVPEESTSACPGDTDGSCSDGVGAGTTCECRHRIVDNTECGWFDPEIVIRTGF